MAKMDESGEADTSERPWKRLRGVAEKAYASGDYGTSESLFQEAIDVASQTNPQSVELALCLMGLAQLYGAQWQHELCEKNFHLALLILQSQLPEDHPTLIGCWKDMALMYQIQGKHAEAEAYYRKLLEVLADKSQSRHELGEVLTAMIEMFQDQGRNSETEAAHKRLIELTKELMGPEHPKLAQEMIDLSQWYEDTGAYDKASDWLKDAVQIVRKAYGPQHPQSISCLKRLMELQEKHRAKSELMKMDVSWQG